MSISWEYYSKRRRIQVSSWVKKMGFKPYDHFLSHLSSQDVRPPVEEDLEVKRAIDSLAKESVTSGDENRPKKTSSQKRPKSRGKSAKE